MFLIVVPGCHQATIPVRVNAIRCTLDRTCVAACASGVSQAQNAPIPIKRVRTQ
jgi:hypothetical protein